MSYPMSDREWMDHYDRARERVIRVLVCAAASFISYVVIAYASV